MLSKGANVSCKRYTKQKKEKQITPPPTWVRTKCRQYFTACDTISRSPRLTTGALLLDLPLDMEVFLPTDKSLRDPLKLAYLCLGYFHLRKLFCE